MSGLSVSDIVNVSVSLSPTAAAVRNFGSLLIVGASDIIDVSERRRSYSSLAAVGADFGASAPEYLAAALFFSQSPQPAQVYVGRWARTAVAGVLHGGPLAASEQVLSAWTSITTGSLKVTVDGTLKTLAALNFSGAANMNAVAAVIATALGASATCTWDAVYSRFNIKSSTTGAASTVTYAGSTGAGVDVSGQLRLTAATGATAPVAGQAAELVTDAVNAHLLSSDWYGLMIADTNPTAADHVAVATIIESASPQRIYGATTQDANALVAGSTTDLAAMMAAGGFKQSTVQYSTSSPYAVASMLGRAFTVNFNGNATTISLMFKGEPGVAAEVISEAQALALQAKKCNVFVAYSNAVAIIQYGTMASGNYFDEVHGANWWQNDLQTEILNALLLSPTKIPQTDAGVNQLLTSAVRSCDRARKNGLIGPGVWTGPTIGSLNTGDTLTDGFYIYAPPIATQTVADRNARKAPTLQVAAKLAGAIHHADVVINVNR